MRRRFCWVAAVLCLQGGWCALSRAESFTTNIISGVSTNAGTYFILGDTGSMNYLEINNGGSLGCVYATIGNTLPASNNTALVTGTNSTLAAANGFGFESAGNSLIVSNGGVLTVPIASYVGDEQGANNNLVLLTGSGSVWNSGSLVIGYHGIANQVQVLNGAELLNTGGVILGAEISSNNALVVMGSKSRLITSGRLFMGEGGSGNQLALSGGASFTCASAQVGGAGNVINVTGSNTVGRNTGSLDLGYCCGGSNQLTIDAGAVVSNTTVSVGDDPISGNNRLVVAGPGTVWHNRDFYFGSSSNNTLLVTNGATVYSSVVIDIGDGSGANNNTVVVTGTNTVWSNSGSLVVGRSGSSGNQMQILDGAAVVSNTSVWVSESINSALIVDGANSLLTSSGTFVVGGFGPGNQFTLSGGATFISAGAWVGDSSNVVLITGGNTVWNNNGSLQFGYCCGNNNQLVISAGAAVNDGGCTISTSSNSILVDGTGTIWNTGWISIADYTSGDLLVLTNGATVNCMGIQGGPGNDLIYQMIITGSNTICNASTMTVGSEYFSDLLP